MQLNKPVSGNLVSQITKSILEEDQSLTIEGYANTVSKDRAGDVIPMETWTKESALGNYRKNPIILAFHNHSKPIGKAVELTVTDMGLYIKAKISKAAGDVYNLIKEGVLSTFSVGFMIKDATYDHTSDTFFINDVELTEVSVVSVPCNQDSVFSISKSVDSIQLSSLKQQFSPVPDDKEKSKMSFDVEKLQAELAAIKNSTAASAAEAATAAVKAALDAQAAEKAAAEKAATEKALAEKAIKDAARAEAAALVEKLQGELAAKDGAFADIVKAQAEQLVSLKDEIAQLVASRNNPLNPVAAGVKGSFAAPAQVNEKEIDRVVMLGMIKNVDMFQTQYGKTHYETVTKQNMSSSVRVSSDSYETVFSQNLMRDIQAELVIAPLFQEITMTSANMTIPINPASGTATWVDAAQYGTDNSTGAEITVQLTERTLKTFKLAAKTYLTEETEEDTIMAVLPILRSHLVEAHAKAIDTAFLNGSGTGQPKGLLTQAAAIGANATEVTTANMGTRVTARMILAARRKLGLYGINLNDVTLVISQDAYWDLIQDTEWGDVQQVGTDAVKLKGEVGNVYGMKVIVSNNFPAKALNAAWGVLVNTSNFVVPRLREVTVKTDTDIVKDRRVFVATQRLNLEPLIEASAGNGKGIVRLVYAAA